MNDTLILPATEDDIPTIQQLAKAIWPVAYGKILSVGQLNYMLKLFYSEESLRRQMAEGQHFFLIQAPETSGFAAVGMTDPGRWKLHKLYVLPDQQGQGLGKKLLTHATAYARSRGATTLSLQVNRANAARAFYECMGFKVVAEKDFAIGNHFFYERLYYGKSALRNNFYNTGEVNPRIPYFL